MYPRGDVWLMVNQSDRIHKKIEEILEVLRAQTHMQVQIEATFMNFNDNFIKDVGVQWENLPLINTGGQSIFGGHIPGAVGQVNYTSGAASDGIFQLSVSFLNTAQTKMIINAAEQSSNAIVTQSPHITCVNTVATSISLTTSTQYIASYVAQGNFVIPVMGIYMAGQGMTVQSWITADRRYVWMNVTPSIVTVIPVTTTVVIPIAAATVTGIASTTLTGASVTVPITLLAVTDNTATSMVKVPDRGTAVFAGLTSVTETRQEQGVPILSHIPVIKRLFLSTRIEKDRGHNVFMVTPTILIEKEFEP